MFVGFIQPITLRHIDRISHFMLFNHVFTVVNKFIYDIFLKELKHSFWNVYYYNMKHIQYDKHNVTVHIHTYVQLQAEKQTMELLQF